MTSSTKPRSQDDACNNGPTTEAPNMYPTKPMLALIVICLVFGSLLVAIDTTIISVAIPRISTHFKTLDDVGWYGSAYLMTLTVFQPTMSNIYKLFDPKTAYLNPIVLFEVVFPHFT